MIRLLFRLLAWRLAPLAVLLMILTGPARAEFMGAGFLTDYYGCERYGWPVSTEMLRARYSAREIDGDVSQLVLVFAVGGVNTYTVAGDLAPSSAWLRAQGQVIWGTSHAMGTRPRLRIMERESVPFAGAPFDARTEHIRLRAQIQNFNGMAGCTVTAVLMLNHWNN